MRYEYAPLNVMLNTRAPEGEYSATTGFAPHDRDPVSPGQLLRAAAARGGSDRSVGDLFHTRGRARRRVDEVADRTRPAGPARPVVVDRHVELPIAGIEQARVVLAAEARAGAARVGELEDPAAVLLRRPATELPHDLPGRRPADGVRDEEGRVRVPQRDEQVAGRVRDRRVHVEHVVRPGAGDRGCPPLRVDLVDPDMVVRVPRPDCRSAGRDLLHHVVEDRRVRGAADRGQVDSGSRVITGDERVTVGEELHLVRVECVRRAAHAGHDVHCPDRGPVQSMLLGAAPGVDVPALHVGPEHRGTPAILHELRVERQVRRRRCPPDRYSTRVVDRDPARGTETQARRDDVVLGLRRSGALARPRREAGRQAAHEVVLGRPRGRRLDREALPALQAHRDRAAGRQLPVDADGGPHAGGDGDPHGNRRCAADHVVGDRGIERREQSWRRRDGVDRRACRSGTGDPHRKCEDRCGCSHERDTAQPGVPARSHDEPPSPASPDSSSIPGPARGVLPQRGKSRPNCAISVPIAHVGGPSGRWVRFSSVSDDVSGNGSDDGSGESRDGVTFTNLDEPLFDGAGATKRDLVDYLDGVARPDHPGPGGPARSR